MISDFFATRLPHSPVHGTHLVKPFSQVFEKALFQQVGQKHPDARHAKSRGMRRTIRYAAMTKDERNEAVGRFSPAG
jgi:hypothetical protein